MTVGSAITSPITRGITESVAKSAPGFNMLVKTDNAGTSNNDQFTIPKVVGQTYDYTWTTSDGQSGASILDTNQTITFAAGAGTYSVEIKGTFPQIKFNLGGDRMKLVDIMSWGGIAFLSMERAFYGCGNLVVITATDAPDLSGCSSMLVALATLGVVNLDLSNWDFSTITTWGSCFYQNFFMETVGMQNSDFTLSASASFMFSNCTVLNEKINPVMPAMVNIGFMYRDCPAFDQDISTMDVSNVLIAPDFMLSSALSTVNYDLLLVGWEAQALQDSVAIDFGGSTYTAASAAATARAAMIADHSWTILDGGTA